MSSGTGAEGTRKPDIFRNEKIMDTVLENIGYTPLVRINKITKDEGVKCEVLAKCEFFNAGGSVKDRIGKRMILDAEASGRIKPGDTLIEPTSGNTGIGLALTAAIRGYKMIITLPEKMSQEKVDVLKALGAQIVRTPTEAAWNAPESHIGVAQRLNQEIPNSHILDQYENPSNPMAHYDGTAEEILYQTDGKVDYVVVGAGTGGTITGIAKKLKEKLPNVVVVGVDPEGSILALPESLNEGGVGSYQVEGIGYDFVPNVLEREYIDRWVKSNDKDSFVMARRLIREEGLLCGGSSGTAMAAAIDLAKTLPADKRVVVILPDSVRNYMTKFLNDDWMIRHKFTDCHIEMDQSFWWSNRTVSELDVSAPYTVHPDCIVADAIALMQSHGFDQVPVVEEDGTILGMVTEGNLASLLIRKRVEGSDPVVKALYKNFRKVTLNTPLYKLSHIFDTDHFALVVASQKCVSGKGPDVTITEKSIITGIVTRIDLLAFIAKHKDDVVLSE